MAPAHDKPSNERNNPENSPFTALDQFFQATLGKTNGGVSPASLGLAYADWLANLAISPGTQLNMISDAAEKVAELMFHQCCDHADMEETVCSKPLPQDHRFDDKQWRTPPFSCYAQSFLTIQNWMQDAIDSVKGVTPHHRDIVQFVNRQWLDALSPSNFIPTNPSILKKTEEEQGRNIVRGTMHFMEDMQHILAGTFPKHLRPFTVGKDMALSKGKVIYRNRLIELLQYEPVTSHVFAEPVFIVPAWIMKYYILDLCTQKSLVEYLVKQGHTVFMISWKNPTSEDRNLTMDDYLKLGVITAMDVIQSIIPNRKIHATGYCLGGTLLAIAAAYLARNGNNRLKSITLFAAQTDFQDAGELMLFVDESQLAFLDTIMHEKGYLDKHQMKSMFQMLRSNDLIWSYIINHYMLGERTRVNALMAWNADATRMPQTMQREYLESCYLRDDLAEGRYKVDGKVVTLKNVRIPIFCVGTERDHVAPWKSVYKIHLLTDTEITFVLTSGGHNAGIVSELTHPRRTYRIHTATADAPYIGPDRWLEKNPEPHKGSWWPAWHRWLKKHSTGEKTNKPPTTGNKNHPPLCDAPGTYVMEE